MDKEAILSNYENLGYEVLTPELVQKIIEDWGLECQNTYSNAENVVEEEVRTHLYLVK